jgi:uncharacterized protein (TIGR00288 family)
LPHSASNSRSRAKLETRARHTAEPFIVFLLHNLENARTGVQAATGQNGLYRLSATRGQGMLRHRIKSALFIDYENVANRALPETIPHWLAWLEEGEFDEAKRRRTFVEKRIYWNATAQKHRSAFEDAGFEIVLCDKFATLKNGADIKMALEMLELTFRNPKVQEFILFTSDSDFIPALQKLTEKSKQTAVIVDEFKLGPYSAYRYQADILISLQELLAAVTYEPPARSFLGFRKKPQEPPAKSGQAQQAAGSKPQQSGAAKKESAGQANKNAAPKAAQSQNQLIDEAAKRVVRLAALTPKSFVGQKKIEGQLKSISGFSKAGAAGYFGTGSYQELMKEIEKRTGRINVTPATGSGIRVKYRTKQD